SNSSRPPGVAMQVMMVSQFGGPEVMQVREAPIPQVQPGEVLVRVLAPGVWPWDVSLRRGGWTGALAYIPGGAFAGLVAGGPGADAGVDEGAPVSGSPGVTGCYAQYVACPAEQLAPVPAGLPVADAAAVPVDALTAEQGLTDLLAVGAGDTVLITAAAGGLGHFAVQIARILGASVVGTASPEHHEFVHALGALAVVDHTKPDWPDEVRKLTDGGVNRVLACSEASLDGAVLAAKDDALLATPVHAEPPGSDRVSWVKYDGAPR